MHLRDRQWDAGINYPSWHRIEDSCAIPGEIPGTVEEEGVVVSKLSMEEIKTILEKNGFEQTEFLSGLAFSLINF